MRLTCCIFIALMCGVVRAEVRVLDEKMHHLRRGPGREWAEFAEVAEGEKLVVAFESKRNEKEWTLRVRHRDVKQLWVMKLNGKEIGKLPQDENDTITYWAAPAGVVAEGKNELVIATTSGAKEDVMLGEVALIDGPEAEVLGEATVNVGVTDAEKGSPLPCRLTIVDERGVLVETGTAKEKRLAIRPGVVYSADGKVALKLAVGKYRIYAGRGFEYSIDEKMVEAKAGQAVEVALKIRREVPTEGWVACDPHVHTFEYSRHGDATLHERMVTLAGEGVELAIAADHNLQVDFEKAANEVGVRQYFTPVIGNEVTTGKGHFNVWPIPKDTRLINFRATGWQKLFEDMRAVAGDPVIILNHPRDLHSGFRPFDEKRFIRMTGEEVDGQKVEANAIELVNSGATTSEPMAVYEDWFGLLNAGEKLVPMGASDSHDVSRYIVGQGRTYIRANDGDAGRIDVGEAVTNLREGKTAVSYGLLVEMEAHAETVRVRVLGPSWTQLSLVEVFANGKKVVERAVDQSGGRRGGIKFEEVFDLRFTHDVQLVAVARGLGVKGAFWPSAKPYQPTSEVFTPYVIGSTAPVWVDGDGSGSLESARDYAQRIVEQAGGDLKIVAEKLARYDDAVMAQAAAVWRSKRPLPVVDLTKGSMAKWVQAWEKYREAVERSEALRGNSKETRPAP